MRGRPRDDASGFAWNGNKVPTFATPPRLTLMRALPSYWFFEVFFESFLLCASLNIHFRLLLMSFSFLQSFLFAYFCFVLPILFCLTVYCEKQRHNVDDTLSCDENRCRRRDEIALKLHEIRNIWNLFPLNSFFFFFRFLFRLWISDCREKLLLFYTFFLGKRVVGRRRRCHWTFPPHSVAVTRVVVVLTSGGGLQQISSILARRSLIIFRF